MNWKFDILKLFKSNSTALQILLKIVHVHETTVGFEVQSACVLEKFKAKAMKILFQ